MEPVLGRFKVIEMWENDVKRVIHIPLDSTYCQPMPFPTSIITTSNNNTTISTSPPPPQQNNAVSSSLTINPDKNQPNRPPPFIDFRQLKQILEPTQTTRQTSNVTSTSPLQRSPTLPTITLIPQHLQSINILPQRISQVSPPSIHQQRASVDNPNSNKVIIHGHLRVPITTNGNSVRNTLQIIPSIINQPQRPGQGSVVNIPFGVAPNFGVQRSFQNVLLRPRFPITQQQPKAPLSIQINNKNYYDIKLLKPPHIVLNRLNNGAIVIDDEQTTAQQSQTSTQNPSSGKNRNKSKRKDKPASNSNGFTKHKSSPSVDDATSISNVAQGLPSDVTTSSAPPKIIPPNQAHIVRLPAPPANRDTNPYSITPSFNGRLKVIIRKVPNKNAGNEQIVNSEVISNLRGPLSVEEPNKDQLPCPNDRGSDSDKQKCPESKKRKRKKSSESNEGSKRQKAMDGSSSEGGGMKDVTSPQNAINILGDILEFGESESRPMPINNVDVETNNVANASEKVNNAETSQVDKIIEDRIDNDTTKRLGNDFKNDKIHAKRVIIAAMEPRKNSIETNDAEINNNAPETVAQADRTETSAMKESQNAGELKTADANSKSQAAKPASTKVFESTDSDSDFETIITRKKPSNNPKKRPLTEGKHQNSKSSEPPTKQSRSTSSSTKHHQFKKTSQDNLSLETRLRLQSFPDDKSLIFDQKLLTDCKVDMRILKLKSESINLINIKAKDLYCCLQKLKGGYKKKSNKCTSSSSWSESDKNVEASKKIN